MYQAVSRFLLFRYFPIFPKPVPIMICLPIAMWTPNDYGASPWGNPPTYPLKNKDGKRMNIALITNPATSVTTTISPLITSI